MAQSAVETALSCGLRARVSPRRNRTAIVARLYFHRSLELAEAAAVALIPRVLKRGTAPYPGQRLLARALAHLYGAGFGADVAKVGERQVVVFGLDVPDPARLGEGREYLTKVLKLWSGLILDPALQDGSLRQDWVDSERDFLARQINALRNDKLALARQRCLEAMFPGRAYAVHRLGRLQDLQGVDAGRLTRAYREMVGGWPAELHVSGPVEPGLFLELLDSTLRLYPGQPPPLQQPLSATPGAGDGRDTDDVQQAKLVMGGLTGINPGHAHWAALLFYNGILGGFAHSKLFRNVREAAGLAYYARSVLHSTAGVLLIEAGIDSCRQEQATAIIGEQLEDMRQGRISREEMDSTRESLFSVRRMLEDDAHGVLDHGFEGSRCGFAPDLDRELSALNAVTVEAVTAVARQVEMVTRYALCPLGEGEA